MYYVGIDWADQKHDIAVVDATGYEIISNMEIPKNYCGFEQLLDTLRGLSQTTRDFKIGIETPHNLLVDFLLDLDYPLYVLNPVAIKGLRKQYRPSGAFDDTFDAFVLAIALLHNQYSWRHIDLGSEPVREIRLLVRDHYHLIKTRTALIANLSAAVKMYYPEYVQFFSNIQCKASLTFLERYPNCQIAQKLSFDELKHFFKEQKAYTIDVEKIYALLHQPHIPIPAPLLAAKKLRAINCVNMLKKLAEDIDIYAARIKALVEKHPDAKRFKTYPGVADLSAARLLGIFGDNRKRYSHYSELAMLAGTCPITERSGAFKHNVYFRRICNKFFRYSLRQISFASLKQQGWIRNYYNKQRVKGKGHNHALRCLANQHLRILFAMWKNKTEYDENIFLAQKARHQIKIETNQLLA